MTPSTRLVSTTMSSLSMTFLRLASLLSSPCSIGTFPTSLISATVVS